LGEAVRAELAEGMLLSGVDTSIVAFHAKKYVPGLQAFTVTRAGFDEDLSYAKEVAEFLRLDHKVYRFASDEALKVVREAAEILSNCSKLVDASGDLLSPTTFVPIYLALRVAKEHVNSVYCGDGADELFLGYPSFTTLDEIMESFDRDDELYGDDFRRAMREYVSTATAQYDVAYPIELGKALDLKVILPYRHPSVVEFAQRTPYEFMIREENEKVYGKWILRKAHEEYLGERVWRKKTPIDFGTGVAELLPALEAQISDIVIKF